MLNLDVRSSLFTIGGKRLTPIISIMYSCCYMATACILSITTSSCPFFKLTSADSSNFTKQRCNYHVAHTREIKLERL